MSRSPDLVRIGEAPSRRATTCSSEASWGPLTVTLFTVFQPVQETVAELTPTNDQLTRFAAEHQPPASWWDERTDPFTSQTDREP